jgi:hypothetical protein
MEKKGENFQCKLPKLIPNASSSQEEYVEFHLIGSNSNILIPSIRVYRLHYLDRRQFNISVISMINDIKTPLLHEWIVYNILLGVEHFILFDNRKVYTHNGLRNASKDINDSALLIHNVLQPFIEANIVTLVYFPYVPVGGNGWQEHWNTIQKTFFITALRQFGVYSKWVGVFDMDEFFLPTNSSRFLYPSLSSGRHHHCNINKLLVFLEQVDREISTKRPERVTSLQNNTQPIKRQLSKKKVRWKPTTISTAISFNTLDTACTSWQPSRCLVSNTPPTTPTDHILVSHCRQVNGSLHSQAHSKAFIKPSTMFSSSFLNPHDIPGSVRGGNSAGLFRHFNRFRYSRHSKWKLSYVESKVIDNTLPQFVAQLMQEAAFCTSLTDGT